MKWISMKERAPSSEGQYLVALYLKRNGRWYCRIKVARFGTSYPQKKPHFYANQTFKAKDISHWMSLPDLPNASQNPNLEKNEEG